MQAYLTTITKFHLNQNLNDISIKTKTRTKKFIFQNFYKEKKKNKSQEAFNFFGTLDILPLTSCLHRAVQKCHYVNDSVMKPIYTNCAAVFPAFWKSIPLDGIKHWSRAFEDWGLINMFRMKRGGRDVRRKQSLKREATGLLLEHINRIFILHF